MALLRSCLAPLFAAALVSCAVDVDDEVVGATALSLTVTQPNTNLNRFVPLASDVAAGASRIRVTGRDMLNLPMAQGGALATGSRLLIIQMQGAQISTSNDSTFGAITDLRGAGQFELATVASLAGNDEIVLGCNLKNGYVASRKVQVVRVPVLDTLIVNQDASIVAPQWNGTTGGIVAIEVTGTTTLQAMGTISATGRGFRGGASENMTSPFMVDVPGFSSDSPVEGARKGESIAGTPEDYDAANYGFLRGAIANGGGGGNSHNAGGGGGANGINSNMPNAAWTGAGVMSEEAAVLPAWRLDPAFIANNNMLTTSPGGGRGGYTFSGVMVMQDALMVPPGDPRWGGNQRRNHGGLGGRPLANDPTARLFMGGGGGAGDGNDGAAGDGGDGGGIVILVTDVLNGAGAIGSQGAAGENTTDAPHSDAPGGGGGGGSVVIDARVIEGSVRILANGGAGGDQTITTNEGEGPGGGGGGGYIAVTNGSPNRAANGGANGTTTSLALTEFRENGATSGSRGTPNAIFTRGTLSSCTTGMPMGADLSVVIADSPDPVPSAGTITYTVNTANAGPQTATNVTVRFEAPSGSTVTSTAGTGWMCSVASRVVTCTRPAAPSGAQPTLTIVVTAPTGVANTILTATAMISGTQSDPAAANNNATAMTTIGMSMGMNTPPVAMNDSGSTTTGNAVTVNVVANDTDANGDPLSVTAVGAPANGTASVGASGNVIYTPRAGFTGTDMFTYTVSDGRGGTAMATVTVTVGAGTADRDNDGLSDRQEDLDNDGVVDANESDPNDADSDDDGVIDGMEPMPLADFDMDGLVQARDPDSDDDGLLDGTELGVRTPHANTDQSKGVFVADEDPSTTTNPLDADTDDGGVTDGGEDTNANGRVDAGERNPVAGNGADDNAITDTDGDGLPDALETRLMSDPNDDDSDDDGVLDGDEPNPGLDRDGDGLVNILDPDSDNDMLRDGTELGVTTASADTDESKGNFTPDADPSTKTSPELRDTDAGSVIDGVEDTNKNGRVDAGERDPNVASDDTTTTPPQGDTDRDGLRDTQEEMFGTDPNDQDSDDDGVLDGREMMPGVDSDMDGMVNALDPDSDNDGLFDGVEQGIQTASQGTDVSAGNFSPDLDPSTTTNPLDADTDDGGVNDGIEDTNKNGRVDDGERNPRLMSDDMESPTTEDGFSVAGGGCSIGSSGNGASLGFIAIVLAMIFASAGRRRAKMSKHISLATFLVAALTSSVALAQTPTNQSFSVERMRYVADHTAMLNVEYGALPRHMMWSVGLWLGYADEPLTVYSNATGERIGSLVSSRVGGSLGGSIALWERIELGFEMPIILSQDGDAMIAGTPLTNDVSSYSFGAGDLTLIPKVGLVRQEDAGIDVAFVLRIGLPVAQHADFRGYEGPTLTPEVAVSRRFGRVRGAVNLAYFAVKQQSLEDLAVDNEINLRLGLGYRLEGAPSEIGATFLIGTAANDPFANANRDPSELDIYATYEPIELVQLFVAGGFGVRRGYGIPDWRALVGVRIGPTGETCAAGPEDVDGFQDGDRCIDPDNDGDGFLDINDRCIDEPENRNEYEDQDGCPDTIPDTDGDGLTDPMDQCPQEPEDRDEFQDDDGCPDPDNDNDTVLDADDRCVNEPGVVANQGCPDADRDSDTVVDRLDNCPESAGPPANQGCPEPQLVVIREGRIDILEKVFFRTNRDEILERSFALLDNVAQVIIGHPELAQIEVQGHTDDRGGDDYNMDLSQRRAQSVVRYLIDKGVATSRLRAQGYGETRPLESNRTNLGRSNNRRVEFHILGNSDAVQQQNNTAGSDTMDRGSP